MFHLNDKVLTYLYTI